MPPKKNLQKENELKMVRKRLHEENEKNAPQIDGDKRSIFGLEQPQNLSFSHGSMFGSAPIETTSSTTNLFSPGFGSNDFGTPSLGCTFNPSGSFGSSSPGCFGSSSPGCFGSSSSGAFGSSSSGALALLVQ